MNKRLLATIPVLLVVFLCTSFPVFANTDMNAERWKNKTGTSSDNKVSYNVQITEGYKETVVAEEMMVANNSTWLRYSNTHYYVWIYLSNDTDQDVQMDQWTFKITLNSADYIGQSADGVVYRYATKITQMRPLSDDNFATITRGDASSIAFSPSTKYANGGKFAIPKRTSLIAMFEIVVQGFSDNYGPADRDNSNLDILYTDLGSKTFTSGNFPITAEWYQLSIQDKSYEDVNPHSSWVDNASDTITNQSDNLHQQETSYYTQTNTALSNTGLSNFSFSSNVVGGLGKAKDHFTYVWNKLGDYKDVYLFSMTLAIALMIIRHVRPIRRKKEE